MQQIAAFYFITVFVIQAAAKTFDFGRHPCSGSKNMKKLNYFDSFSLLASVNTIFNSKNKPGDCYVYRVGYFEFSVPLACF